MRIRLFVPGLIAVGLAFYFWQTAPEENVPACTWRVGNGTEMRQAQENFEELAPETPIRLSMFLHEPRWVYVFEHSDEDGTILMFPSPDVRSDRENPLPAGRTVLPGEFEGKELAWTARPGLLAVRTYMVVASDHAIGELEELLPKVRRWTNTVFPDHAMGVTQPAAGAAFVAGPREPIPPGLLRDAAAIGSAEPSPNGPMARAAGYEGVFTASWKVREKKGAAPAPGAVPALPQAPPAPAAGSGKK